MKSITIQGTKRESVGKKSTKALRDAELVPCVVYGGAETLNFSAEERAFKGLVYTPEAHTVSIRLTDKQFLPYFRTSSFTQSPIRFFTQISIS